MIVSLNRKNNYSDSIFIRKSILLLKNSGMGLDIPYEIYLEKEKTKGNLVDENSYQNYQDFLDTFYKDNPNQINPYFLPLDIKIFDKSQNKKETKINSNLSINQYIRSIINEFKEDINIVLGDSGSGKTTLMVGIFYKLLNDISFQDSYLPVYLNFDSNDSDIYRTINASSQSIFRSKINFKKIVEPYLKYGKPLLFMFDTSVLTSPKINLENNKNEHDLELILAKFREEINGLFSDIRENKKNHKLVIFHRGNLNYFREITDVKIYNLLKNYGDTFELEKLEYEKAYNYLNNISDGDSEKILEKIENKEIIRTPIFLDFINFLSLSKKYEIKSQSHLYLLLTKYYFNKKLDELKRTQNIDNIYTWSKIDLDNSFFDINNINLKKIPIIEFILQKIAIREINTINELNAYLKKNIDFSEDKEYSKLDRTKLNSDRIIENFIIKKSSELCDSIIRNTILTIRNEKIEFFHDSYRDFFVAYSIFFDEHSNFVNFENKEHYKSKVNKLIHLSSFIVVLIKDLLDLYNDKSFFDKTPLNSIIYFFLGNFYYKNKQYDQAIKYYTISTEINSINFKSYNNLGLSYYKNKNYSLSIENFQKAIKINPNDSMIYDNLTKAYSDSGDYDNVQKYFLKSVNVIPLKDKNINISKYLNQIDLSFNIDGLYEEIDESDYNNKIQIDLNIESLLEQIKLDPNDSFIYYKLGNFYSKNNEFSKSIEYYLKSIEKGYKEPIIYFEIASIYSKNNEFSKSIEYYLKSIEKEYKEPIIYFELGKVYSKNNEFNKSIEYHLKSIEKGYKGLDIYYELGFSYFKLKDFSNAIFNFGEAIKNTNDHRCYCNLGIIYFNQQKYDSSVDNFNKAILLAPNEAKYYNNLANAYFNQEKYNLAIDNFNKALKLDSQIFLAFSKLGKIYFNQKKYELSIENYKKALDINPKHTQSFFELGLVYSDINEFDESIKYYFQALEFEKNNSNIYFNLALSYQRKNDFNSAIKYFINAIKINKNDSESYFKLGQIYLDMKEYDLAIINYNKALKISPDEPIIYFELGLAYFDINNIDKAIEFYLKGLELEYNYDALYNLGKCYYKKNNYKISIEYYNKAIELDSNISDAYYNLGLIYQETKEYKKAIYYYEKCISLEPEHFDAIYNLSLISKT